MSMPSKGVEKKARQRKKKVHRWRVHTAYSIDTQDSSDYLVFFPLIFLTVCIVMNDVAKLRRRFCTDVFG